MSSLSPWLTRGWAANLILPTLAALVRVGALPGFGPGWLILLYIPLRLLYWEHGGRRWGDAWGGFLACGLAGTVLSFTSPWLPLGPAILLGPFWILEGMAYRRLRHFLSPALAGPGAVFLSEWFRAHWLFGGLPWQSPALGWAALPGGPELAFSVGEMGLTALVLLAGGWLWKLGGDRQRRWELVVFPLALLLAGLPALLRPAPRPNSDSLDCLAIQPNIEVGEKTSASGPNHILNRHLSLAEGAVAESQTRPEMLLWAETMFLFPVCATDARGELQLALRGNPENQAWPVADVLQLQRAIGQSAAAVVREGGWFVTGAHFYPMKEGQASGLLGSPRHSSVLAMDPGGNLRTRRDKSRLVPFGEHLPFGPRLPGAAKIARWIFDNFGLIPDFQPGATSSILVLPRADGSNLRLGAAVCWENTFPEVFREQALAGAQAFVVLSNEAWYGLGPEMDQMLAATRFRAAETGRAILRVTNTGLTVLVNSRGRVLADLPRGTEAHLRSSLPLVEEGLQTPYLGWGWRISGILASSWGFVLLLALFPRRRKLST